ncbi:MAG: LysM peptidoglycan-binding domain-containing M23 family metallopeptidase [Synergistaceae bacterium]|nr:LysM peptidoglycan-binding domain-containing M23 family metallopeptidase [Synergistaceae bacterium]
MRSDREPIRDFVPSKRDKANSRNKKRAGVSLGFCWAFGVVVCVTFGLASFLMYSAGHFKSFSSNGGVNPAWGGSEGEENFTSTSGLIHVEVTELEDAKLKNENNYAQVRKNSIEEFGPLPKYLSDYENIILSVHENGKDLPKNEDDEEEEDIELAEVVQIEVEDSSNKIELVEQGPAWTEHIVKEGETLSDIAEEHGNITVQDILQANGLKDANRISANQLLFIPNDPSKIEDTLDEVRTRQMRVASTKEVIEPIKTKSYVVVQGDSLWSIANSQGVELDTIIGSNKFKTSARLRPGAILRIPNQDGIFYVLKKDEKIEDVSKRYGVKMSKIRAVNVNLDVAKLKTGDEVFLPGARPDGLVEHKEAPKAAEVKKAAPAPAAKTVKQPVKQVAKTETKNIKPQRGEVAVRTSGLRWPLMGRINSPFGWRQHPITKRKDFHTGIDIKGNRGDPIKAAGSGKVVYSGWMGGYGKVIVIEHSNGQSTLYAHCQTLLAGKGNNVSSGSLIAKVGTTGRSTGPHLHFEVRNGSSPVNPIKYLSR